MQPIGVDKAVFRARISDKSDGNPLPGVSSAAESKIWTRKLQISVIILRCRIHCETSGRAQAKDLDPH